MNHGDIYKFAGEEGRKSEIVTKSVSWPKYLYGGEVYIYFWD
jgi:hypothetical protein